MSTWIFKWKWCLYKNYLLALNNCLTLTKQIEYAVYATDDDKICRAKFVENLLCVKDIGQATPRKMLMTPLWGPLHLSLKGDNSHKHPCKSCQHRSCQKNKPNFHHKSLDLWKTRYFREMVEKNIIY